MVLALALIQDGSNWNDLVQFFSDPGSLINPVKSTGYCIGVAEALMPLFFFISLGWNYVDTWIREGHRGRFYNPAELKRTLTVAILIPLIPAMFGFIHVLGDGVAKVFEMDIADKRDALFLLTEKLLRVGEEQKINLLGLSMSMVLDVLSSAMMFCSLLGMYIIRFVMQIFVAVFIKFLIMASPLAMAFSLIPAFKYQMTRMLAVFTNACFVGVTINLLDRLFFDSLIGSAVSALDDSGSGVLFNKVLFTSICFAIMVLYLLSIRLTSKYVGAPGASAVVGMAVKAATAAVLKTISIIGSVGVSEGIAATQIAELDVVKTRADAIRES